jgi:hypothetical protein
MSRPRSTVLKIGDKVSHKKKEGVVVFVEPNSIKPYNVHFYPSGRGLFGFSDLEKVKPLFQLAELVDEDDLIIKEVVDAQ